MNDPLSALHHFRRYLTLSPNGSHAGDVKNSMKRDEVAVLTTLSGDSVVTRAEAARLRNENLDLHKEIEGRARILRSGPDKSKGGDGSTTKTAYKNKGAQTAAEKSGESPT